MKSRLIFAVVVLLIAVILMRFILLRPPEEETLILTEQPSLLEQAELGAQPRAEPTSTLSASVEPDNDIDNDGLLDSIEIALGRGSYRRYSVPSDIHDVNSDGDGSANDYDQLLAGENPRNGFLCYLDDRAEFEDFETDPTAIDTDNDGISDCFEIFVYNTNPSFGGSDTDDDGFSDLYEIRQAISPTDRESFPNTSYSELPVWWLTQYFEERSLQLPEGDPDDDGCDNQCEYQRGTNPSTNDVNTCIVDTENNFRFVIPNAPDGFGDGFDTDCDGINDGVELPDSSPTSHDTDRDGLIDGYEMQFVHTMNSVEMRLSPRNVDTDSDGLTDYEEAILYQTNPLIFDTDAGKYRQIEPPYLNIEPH